MPSDGAVQFLRWAGSKRKLLPILTSYWRSEFHRYVEPFMGSACLFYALRPHDAVLSDINTDLVNTFVAVRDHPLSVFRSLETIPLGRESYYMLRATPPEDLSPAKRAARFIFLNRFCFNGLYRTNSQGRFNVPFSPSKTGRLPTKQELMAAARALRCAQLVSADFEQILNQTTRGDFVYLDPPYAVANRRVFSQYDPTSFGISDLERLSDALKAADRRGVSFVLSYAYCREAICAFGSWNMRRLFIHRNIAGFSMHRRRAAELVVSNTKTLGK